jgi:hypothetical protein
MPKALKDPFEYAKELNSKYGDKATLVVDELMDLAESTLQGCLEWDIKPYYEEVKNQIKNSTNGDTKIDC